jgi:hypothetical protein
MARKTKKQTGRSEWMRQYNANRANRALNKEIEVFN